VAILDASDVWSAMMAYRAPGRIVWVQSGPAADASVQPTWQANQIHVNPRGVSFDLVHAGESISVTLPLFNRIMVKNALLAAAVGGECGLSLAEIARGLEAVQLPGARMSVVTYNDGVTIINDAYNANPDSMQAALTALGEFPGAKRRLAVLGSMGELGSRSAELHQQVGRFAARFPLAAMILVGPWLGELVRGAEEAGFQPDHIFTAGDARDAADVLQRIALPGDVILVKGSHFLGLDSIADKWAAQEGAQT
jgi:UDP-N-acetylmuramoyl-tripeptide--D-alanyl-D-alanine ligase